MSREERARLAPILLDVVRRLRLARLIIRRSRARYLAVVETLHAAVELLRELDQELDVLRAQNAHLREELRRYTADQVRVEFPS